ncbi:MAG: TIGR03545 family protein [Nitrospinae bacterium]|nr:TIGR03545 family protein [Nitrospinota bacterium]
MKFFRWQGVIAFAIIGGAVAVFLMMFLDGIIERGIEENGSQAAKTQIDLASLSTSLLSQAVRIDGLEVANPDNNLENILQIETLSMDVDGPKAISRKIIIDELTANGIRINQKRASPAKDINPAGKTESASEENRESGAMGLPDLGGVDIKSPEEILKSEKLETLEAANKAKETIENLKIKWQKRIETDLSPKSLEETKQKLAKLQEKVKGGNLASIPETIQEFKSLQKEIQDRVNRIKSIKSEFEKDVHAAKKQLAELKNLPKKDFNRLNKKYSLDMDGGSNALGALIEGPLKAKIDKAWKAYKMLSPYLNKPSTPKKEDYQYVRGKGADVQFAKASIHPDFLLRHANLSMNLLETEIQGELKDLTDNPKLHGKPAILKFQSGKNEKFDSFNLNLELDKTGEQSKDTLSIDFKGLNLQGIQSDGSGEIKGGAANVKGQLLITDENNLNGTFKAELKSISLSIAKQDGNELANSIAKSLSSIDRISITVDIQGTIENYELGIQSNLNDIISGAVKKALAGKMEGFESSLMEAIQAKAGDSIAGANGSLSGLLGQSKILEENQSAYGGLLGQAKGGASGLKSPLALPGGLKLPF